MFMERVPPLFLTALVILLVGIQIFIYKELMQGIPLLLITSFVVGLVGMQILIYKEVLLEGNRHQALKYAVLSYLHALKEIWQESKRNAICILLLLPFIGWVFILSLLPTVILKTLRIIKAQNNQTGV